MDTSSSENYSRFSGAIIRFLARIIDLGFFILIINLFNLILAIFFNVRLVTYFQQNMGNDLTGILGLILWCVFFDSILMTYYGYTLGKYLLNIRVRTIDGRMLSFSQNLVRGWWVFLVGLGGGVFFLISLIFLFFRFIIKGNPTYWDKKAGSRVTISNLSFFRASLSFILTLVFIFLLQIILSNGLVYLHKELLPLPSADYENSLQIKIDKLNQQLPKKVAPTLEFSSISLSSEDKIINFNLKFTFSTNEPVKDRKSLINVYCPKYLDIFKKGYKLDFNYFDVNDKFINTQEISYEDCAAFLF